MSEDAGLAALLRLLDDCLADTSADAPARWEQFVSRIHGLIAGAVVRTLRQSVDAPPRALVDDLVQDTYVKLCADNLAALRRFRGGRPEALVAYLRAVACSVTRDYLRAEVTAKRGAGRIDALDETSVAIADASAAGESLDRQLLFAQLDRWLTTEGDEATGRRDRWIFWLYYRHGLTAKAIAAIPAVGLTAKGVESTIHRLTQSARKVFGAKALPEREGNDVGTASR
jgi:RNA polymerase sigma-70 factor (ECF subfamily)